MKKLLYLIATLLLLCSECMASPEKFTNYIYDASNICIKKGVDYYNHINKNLTFEEMGTSKSIDHVIRECLVEATDRFDNDKSFQKMFAAAWKKQNIVDYFYSIGMCNFSAGYTKARTGNTKSISQTENDSIIEKCNALYQHLLNY